jgi:hypothetical protein
VSASSGLSDDMRARLRAVSERRLSAEEFAQAEAVPISEAEREETLALICWFTRRYPTPADRLAYVRVATARWRGHRVRHPPASK